MSIYVCNWIINGKCASPKNTEEIPNEFDKISKTNLYPGKIHPDNGRN